MVVSLSAKIRAVLYVLTAVGTPVIAYLNTKGYIGADEVALWSAEVTVVGGMAAFKALSPDAQAEREADDA